MNYMKRIIAILAIVSLIGFIPSFANAQFEKVSHDVTRLAVGLSGSRDGQAVSGAFSTPLTSKESNFTAWGNVFGNQITANSEIITQSITAHLQGGYRFDNSWGVEAFANGGRDTAIGTSFAGQLGVFVRMGVYNITDWLTITGGLGNYFENVQVHEAFGIEESLDVREELELTGTVNRGLALFNVTILDSISTVVKLTPEITLKDWQIEATPGVTFNLAENLSFTFQGKVQYHTVPITEKLNYSYSNILAFTF